MTKRVAFVLFVKNRTVHEINSSGVNKQRVCVATGNHGVNVPRSTGEASVCDVPSHTDRIAAAAVATNALLRPNSTR